MGQHLEVGSWDEQLRWRRNRDLREWVAARGWSEVDGSPALAAAVGRPHWAGTGVVMAAEGTWSGRRAAVARHTVSAGEGWEDETVVWAEVRRPVADRVVGIHQRMYERRLRRAPITGHRYFDRLFRVWPRDVAPALPRGLLVAVLRGVGDRRLVLLAPGSVQLSDREWLRPPGLERLLDQAAALADAADAADS